MAGLSAAVPSWAADPRIPDQILVFRSPRATRLEVFHIPGDAAAKVRISDPPKGVVELLRDQRGPFVRQIEVLAWGAGHLDLLLRLSNDAVAIEAQRLSKPSGWSMVFRPQPDLPFPKTEQFMGRFAGIVAAPAVPVLLPIEPEDPPCTANPDARPLLQNVERRFLSEAELELATDLLREPMCRSWAISRLATRALYEQSPLAPFERWAFEFYYETDQWPVAQEAFAQVSLVAAEILSRRGYIPEAEALLSDATRFEDAHAPFRAMALANHFSNVRQHREAETLYRQLVREGFDPWVIHQASLARALNALAAGDAKEALTYIAQADRLLPPKTRLPGDLWVVGGEASLAVDRPDLAHRYYRRAARSVDPPSQGLGLLRLADLEARQGKRKSALVGWSMAEQVGSACLAEHVHLRRLLLLEGDRDEVINYLKSTGSFSRCEGLRLEADLSLALIHAYRGDEELGLERVLRNGKVSLTAPRPGELAPTSIAPSDGFDQRMLGGWGPVRPHRAMVKRLARSAIQRHARHHDPASLVDFFEKYLNAYVGLMDPESRRQVGLAYSAIGAHPRGAEELLALLTSYPGLPFAQTLILDLGEALLGSGDIYRTGLILRHLETEHPPSVSNWRRRQLSGRFKLSTNRPEESIGDFRQARSLLPEGSKRRRMALYLTRALLAQGQVMAAAQAMKEASSEPTLPDSELLPLAIDVLSVCARKCSSAALKPLARELFDRLGVDDWSPRLVAQLARRGALPQGTSQVERSELWSRLSTLGVEPGRTSERKKP